MYPRYMLSEEFFFLHPMLGAFVILQGTGDLDKRFEHCSYFNGEPYEPHYTEFQELKSMLLIREDLAVLGCIMSKSSSPHLR